jgi:hypothetical protein
LVEKAVEAMTEASRLEPGNPVTLIRLGSAEHAAGKVGSAANT